jgi:hypothetical protein
MRCRLRPVPEALEENVCLSLADRPAQVVTHSTNGGRMADTQPAAAAPAPAITPGLQTSEGKAALVAVILGVLGTALPPVIAMFSELGKSYPNSALLATIASVLAIGLTCLTATGYAKQRTTLKVAALNQQGFAQPWLLLGVAVAGVLMLGLSGCATFSRVGGTTGDLQLGRGYVCSATVGVVDSTACTRKISTHCTGPNGFDNVTETTAPVPKAADGTCP